MATSSTPLNNPSSTRRKRAAYAMPLVAVIAISCLMALMFYPMMNAQVRELPVAVLSLDEGASTPQGEMNVGSTLVTKLTDTSSANGDETPMRWTEVKSQDDLDSAFADHEYYAAITIPADFTAKQVAAKQASVKSQIDSAITLAQAEAEQQGLTGAAAQQHVQAALGWSLMIALGACSVTAMVGSGWPPTPMIAFLWLASFAIITVLLSLMNIALPLGVICGALGLGLGMTSGMFPYELLPRFWQDWVYGWVPQHYIGNGVRAVLYSGEGWWNAGSAPLVIMLYVGLAIFVISGLLPLGRQRRRGRD